MKHLFSIACLTFLLASCGDSSPSDEPVKAVFELAEYDANGNLISLSNIGAGKRIDVNKGLRFMEMYSMEEVMSIFKQINFIPEDLDTNLKSVDTRFLFLDEYLKEKAIPGYGFEILMVESKAEQAKISNILNSEEIQNKFPPDLELMWSYHSEKRIGEGAFFILFAVKNDLEKNVMTGLDVSRALSGIDQNTGKVTVDLKLTIDGTEKFGLLSTENVNRSIAIVMNDKVLSAPNVIQPILAGNIQISGSFSMADSKDLVNQINAFTRNGAYQRFHRNGKIKQKRNYVSGESSGPWSLYDENGKLIREYKE